MSKRATRVSYNDRCFHVQQFAEVFGSNTLNNRLNYVIQAFPDAKPKERAKLASKLYNWIVRDNSEDYFEAMKVNEQPTLDFGYDSSEGNIGEYLDDVQYDDGDEEQDELLEDIQNALMSISKEKRISFLETFLQLQKI